MPWNAVIENIVTDTELNAAVAPLALDVDLTSGLATKVNASNGTASNLSLTDVGVGSTAAISRAELTTEVNTINGALATKMGTAGGTFTGNITIPDATVSGHAVNLGQLAIYLPLAGGTITGPIVYGSSPTLPTHLTNKQYVDGVVALKADITYVDSEIAALPTQAAVDLKAPINSPTFTGTPQAPSPSTADNSTRLATTAFTQSLIASYAPLASPALTGSPTAPTQLLADDSTKIATTEWVRDYVASVLP